MKNEACLPNIEDIFDTIQGSKSFTKLDLRSGYNQVRVRDEDVAKTAINTPLGHYEFKVMGFGLCNAPDRKKLQAVENWLVPRNVSQVRSFLGFGNYFRRFVCHYAELAKPLDQIPGRHSVFSWNEERQQAFEDIKSALITAPVLHLADVSKPFRIHTDASDIALGTVLLQEYDDNWHPVAYASRKLTHAEKNYTIME